MAMINPNITPYTPGINPSTTGGSATNGAGTPGSSQATSLGSAGQQGAIPGSKQDVGGTTGASLAPTGPSPSSLDPQAATQQLSDLKSFLSLAHGLDVLGELLIKFANEQQKDALQQRLQSRETSKQDLLTQAGEMDKAAQEMRSSAIASLVISVVSSVVTIAMAGASMGVSKDAAGELSDVKSLNAPEEESAAGLNRSSSESEAPVTTRSSNENASSEPSGSNKTDQQDSTEGSQRSEGKRQGKQEEQVKESDSANHSDVDKKIKAEFEKFERDVQMMKISSLNTKAQNLSSLGQSMGQLGQGFANFATSEGQAESKEADAAGARDAALAQDSSAQEDVGKSLMEAAQQLISQIIGLLKELGDAKAEQMQTMTRV